MAETDTVATSTIGVQRGAWSESGAGGHGGAAGDRLQHPGGACAGPLAAGTVSPITRQHAGGKAPPSQPVGSRHDGRAPDRRAWITTGGTGAQNYDEFADDAEITEIIAANPHSALAIEMPHRAPESLGKSFLDASATPPAGSPTSGRTGSYTPAEQVVVLYRITVPASPTAYGLWCMVDTDQISTSADEPGLVIRNEDVFIAKVRERVALAEALRTLLSPVLLLQTGQGDELHAALAAATDGRGRAGRHRHRPERRTHAIWVVPAARCRPS